MPQSLPFSLTAEELLESRYDLSLPSEEAIEGPARLSIKDWHESDQPREKFMARGRDAVSDAELLGILLGSGTTTDSAVDLGRKLLALAGNSLHRLSRLEWRQLKGVKGVGDARAITIAAALELGRRHAAEAPVEQPTIRSAGDAYQQLAPYMTGLRHEQMWVMLLSQAHKVLRLVRIGEGGISGVLADPRLVFRQALLESASALIVAHNHPSGTLRPSPADDGLTSNLASAGKFLDIPVLDHLIFTDHGYYSYKDEGRI